MDVLIKENRSLKIIQLGNLLVMHEKTINGSGYDGCSESKGSREEASETVFVLLGMC